ncbi:SSS family solute:Na+ symporter [Rhizomicrobium palustre]|uniref:SSS family solute:Na+ symporter n=1 Tax=Rhizomicrobium palustre TaxID=189966 RepID=A0A846MZM6_9PROT|nr:sodium:solute symporter [Rhizomicrobium palustre]NIK88387.1 SSS family solute:Na+ symporter [Rhizomicrobium palustre]
MSTATAGALHGPVFNTTDWIVVAVFIAVMLAVIVASMSKKANSGKDYFLSGRDSGWLQIGSSIFSSNIGSEHLVGLAGAGFATGMAMAHWEMQAWIILCLGWVFVPLYDRMKVFTMPEFLELRFSRGSRNVLSLLTIASLVLTKIAATIYAGDVVVRTLLGIESVNLFGFQVDVFWVIALGLAFTTGLYTVLGGLRVIMYTSVLQAPVLIFGSLCILWTGLHVLGHGDLIAGWNATVHAAGKNIHLIRSFHDPEWSWAAVLPASMIIGFWYWCTDQYIVQRVLAGRDQKQSRRGTILAAYFKLTPVFIFLVPGMIAYALTQTPGSGFTTSGDAAYTSMVAQILPHGLRGMVACAMIVALMASLGSKFNASATLFTMDFFREWYPNASGKTEVLVGRIATAVIVAIGICWVLVIKALSSNLYTYLQSVQSYLSPAIVVLFALGVFWKRANAKGALVAFVFGVVAGFARLAADIYMRAYEPVVKSLKEKLFEGSITQAAYDAAIAPIQAQNGLIFTIWHINWLYYCQILFVITAAIMVTVSLLTKAPDPKTVRFTWYGATPEEKAATRASWGTIDVVLSVVAVLFVIAFYITFF